MKSVVQNTLLMFGQNAIVTVLTFVITAYIGRELGKVDYGMFAYAFAFSNVLTILSTFGLRSVTVRAVAQDPSEAGKAMGEILSLRVLLALFAMLIYWAATLLLHSDHRMVQVLLVASMTVVFTAASTTIRDLFQGKENMSVEAVTQVVIRLTTMIGAFLALVLGGGVLSVVVAYTLGSVAGLMVPFLYLRKEKISVPLAWPGRNSIALLKKGFPFWTNGIFGILLAKINPILVGAMAGPAAVGVFAAAGGFMGAILVIPDAIATSLFPTAARGFKDPSVKLEALLDRVLFYLALIGLPIGVGGAVCADSIIHMVFGPKFEESGWVFRILILAMPFEFLSLPTNYVLGAIHRQNTVLRITISGAVINVLGNLILIPKYGANGSAISALVTSAFWCATAQFVLRKHFRVFSHQSLYVRIALANLLMGAALFPIRDRSALLLLPLGAFIYLILIFLLRLMTVTQALAFMKGSLGWKGSKEPGIG